MHEERLKGILNPTYNNKMVNEHIVRVRTGVKGTSLDLSHFKHFEGKEQFSRKLKQISIQNKQLKKEISLKFHKEKKAGFPIRLRVISQNKSRKSRSTPFGIESQLSSHFEELKEFSTDYRTKYQSSSHVLGEEQKSEFQKHEKSPILNQKSFENLLRWK